MSLEANPGRYAAYQFARNLYFWLPVFFLFFASRVGLDRVLYLEAIYYAGVVALEVPSGYAADRFGRRATLVLGAVLAAGAHLAFVAVGSFGFDFALLVAGQLLLAGAMAFNSGSDSALLYDSLVALGREGEYAAHEARAQGWGFLAGALAALAGGIAAGVDLRLAYALSLGGGLLTLVASLALDEPPAERTTVPFGRQLRQVASRVRRPVLAWCLAFVVVMTVLNHVPYEFYQSYLGLLLGGAGGGYDPTPMAAGVLMAATMAAGGVGSRLAPALRDRLRGDRALLLTTVLQLVVILSMGLVLHPAVAVLIVFRSVPRGILTPILGEIVHRQLDSRLRATYLSVQSLAGRLAFSLSLAVAGWSVGAGAVADHATLGRLLVLFGAGGLVAWLALAALRPGPLRDPSR